MPPRSSTRPGAISGKDKVEVKQDLLRNIIRMKNRLKTKFDEIYHNSSMDHVRSTVKDFSIAEEEDIAELNRNIEEGTAFTHDLEASPAEDYETFDHLIMEEPEVDNNDLKSVLMLAIKYHKDLYDILKLMETEYPDPSIKESISAVAAKELGYKRKTEDLLEERVHKDYW